jgi:hypothetical protein
VRKEDSLGTRLAADPEHFVELSPQPADESAAGGLVRPIVSAVMEIAVPACGHFALLSARKSAFAYPRQAKMGSAEQQTNEYNYSLRAKKLP